MSASTEPQIIAAILDQARKLTLIYVKRLVEVDVHKRFVIEDKAFNSAYWEIAHLAWAEAGLVLKTIGKPYPLPEWLRQFTLGSNPDVVKEMRPLPELLDTLADIHHASLEALNMLDPAVLDQPSELQFLNWKTDVRHVLYHAIRHEGVHTGHLGWLCKLHGIKVI